MHIWILEDYTLRRRSWRWDGEHYCCTASLSGCYWSEKGLLSFIYTFLYTINHCDPKRKLKKLICIVMQVRNKRRTWCDIWYVSKLNSELVIEMTTLGNLGTWKVYMIKLLNKATKNLLLPHWKKYIFPNTNSPQFISWWWTTNLSLVINTIPVYELSWGISSMILTRCIWCPYSPF